MNTHFWTRKVNVTSIGPLRYVEPWTEGWYMATCPGCGLRGRIHEDQYRGQVSVDCSECEYHETHDHSEGEANDG